MDVGKLRDAFPKLTALEIVEKISKEDIAGMWLTDYDHRKARKLLPELTEEDAEKLIDEFDRSRQYGYNFWKMFD